MRIERHDHGWRVAGHARVVALDADEALELRLGWGDHRGLLRIDGTAVLRDFVGDRRPFLANAAGEGVVEHLRARLMTGAVAGPGGALTVSFDTDEEIEVDPRRDVSSWELTDGAGGRLSGRPGADVRAHRPPHRVAAAALRAVAARVRRAPGNPEPTARTAEGDAAALLGRLMMEPDGLRDLYPPVRDTAVRDDHDPVALSAGEVAHALRLRRAGTLSENELATWARIILDHPLTASEPGYEELIHDSLTAAARRGPQGPPDDELLRSLIDRLERPRPPAAGAP